MVGVGAKVTTHSWQNSSVCPSCPPKRGQVTRSGTVASLPVEGVGRGPSPTSMTQGPALWTGLSVQNPAGGLTQKTAPPQPSEQRPQAQEAIRTGVRVQGRESRMQRQFCPSLQKQKPPLGGGTLRNGWEWERGPVWPGQKRPSLAQGAPLGSGGGPASKGPEEVGGIRPSLHRAPSSGVILWVSPQFSMWNKALWLQQRRPWAPELCPTLSQHAALEGTRTHPDGWHGPGGTHRPCWKVTWLRGTWSCQPPSCTEGPRGQPDAARLPQRVTRRPTSGTPQAHGFPRALAAAGRQPWTDVVISGPALFTPAPPHGRMGLTGMPSTVGCHEEGGAVGTWWGRD